MKKSGIMHKDLSAVIAGMGHGDEIMINGSAFPIPDSARRIDLALEPGLPAFMDVVRIVCKELVVERVLIAEETQKVSPKRFEELIAFFKGIPVDMVPQSELKQHAHSAKACVRTGECTKFSNVVLIGGVIF